MHSPACLLTLGSVRNCDFDQCEPRYFQLDAWEQKNGRGRPCPIRVEFSGHVSTSGLFAAVLLSHVRAMTPLPYLTVPCAGVLRMPLCAQRSMVVLCALDSLRLNLELLGAVRMKIVSHWRRRAGRVYDRCRF